MRRLGGEVNVSEVLRVGQLCVCVCARGGPRSKYCLCVSEGVVINDPQALFLLLPSSAAMSHTHHHMSA